MVVHIQGRIQFYMLYNDGHGLKVRALDLVNLSVLRTQSVAFKSDQTYFIF